MLNMLETWSHLITINTVCVQVKWRKGMQWLDFPLSQGERGFCKSRYSMLTNSEPALPLRGSYENARGKIPSLGSAPTSVLWRALDKGLSLSGPEFHDHIYCSEFAVECLTTLSVEVQGKFLWVISLLQGPWGSNSDHQAWQQAPLTH